MLTYKKRLIKPRASFLDHLQVFGKLLSRWPIMFIPIPRTSVRRRHKEMWCLLSFNAEQWQWSSVGAKICSFQIRGRYKLQVQSNDIIWLEIAAAQHSLTAFNLDFLLTFRQKNDENKIGKWCSFPSLSVCEADSMLWDASKIAQKLAGHTSGICIEA